MATAMDENYNGINDSTSNKPTTATTTTADDVPDYNEAFPQLCSAGKTDDDRRRKLVQHASSSSVTKIIEIPPEERVPEKPDGSFRRGPTGPSRNPPGANSSGQTIQKICQRIQKDTTTTITFMYKNQTLLVTITGRPEQVRLAQVQLLREIQRPVQKSVVVPWDFHRYIIGTKGATLKSLEQETGTNIKVPSQDSQSSAIIVEGAKDNVNLCEQKILRLYQTQLNKGFERLAIPYLYHPWIRHHLLDDLQRQYGVTISLPPVLKQADEVIIRGEREPVEQAKANIMQYYKKLEGKIMTFPLEIPCEQHRFILGKKGAGLKDIFDKTNVVVRIPNQEENASVIQVMGETEKIGEAITMIYKMANAVTVVQIPAARWMQNQIRGDHNSRLDGWRTAHPDVRVTLREDHIALEGPPEEVKQIRNEIQVVIDDLNKRNIICVEVDIDPQYYKQLIGKSQARLNEIQDQTSCEIKFPFDEGRIVQIMGTKENAEKARKMLVERAQKLSSEHTIEVSIDPKYHAQLIGTKGKNLEEIRTKYHNIQITFPEMKDKSDKVILHGNKEDVEQCSKYLQQKFKDLHSAEIAVPKRLYPMLIGKGGANIQRLREKVPDVRIDMPSIDDTKESTPLRLNGKKSDVDKARQFLEEHIAQLNTSMENSIEQTITIDPKWHSRFFLYKRKLLNELQQQYGEMLIKIPERTSNSDQVVLRGPKETLEQVRKRLEELIDTWEHTTTKEMTIPHRHHGYLLAHGGAQIQPIQKDHNVQIKFPPRPSNSKDEQQQQQESNVDEHQQDVVRITGRSDDIDRAIVALEKVIPIELSFDIPYEGHGSLVGKGGANLQALNKQYQLVQITFPPMNSSQNTITLKGQRDQVEAVRKELQESYDKYQADQQARSFEVRFSIKPEYRALILGARGKNINALRQQYDVRIEVTHNATPSTAIVPTPSATNQEEETPVSDDQQAIPEENVVLPSETNPANALNDVEVVITGYEDKALACRDDILQSIKEYEAKITMEIEIDPRIHARIIGSSGHKLKQIMKDYNVEIKFQANNKSDKVHVIGLDQEKIDACIDHLLVLEEEFLQDLPYRPSSSATQSTTEYPLGQSASHVQQQQQQQQQQEVPSTKSNHGKQQAPFQVKNAPWTNGNGNENEHYQQQTKYSRQRNGHENSPKKAASIAAPNRDDLAEYPSFSNGAHPNTDDVGSQVQKNTVNSLPVIWGPQKRNK